MREWQVSLDLLGTVVCDSFNIDEILDRLKPWHVSLSLGGHALGVTMTLRAPSASEALDKGLRIVKRAVPTVMTSQLLNAEIRPMATARDPEYLGVSELAEFFDLPPARLAQLVDGPGFPMALAQVRSGPIWKLSSILRYASRQRA